MDNRSALPLSSLSSKAIFWALLTLIQRLVKSCKGLEFQIGDLNWYLMEKKAGIVTLGYPERAISK
jgi:hypothetical protein